MDELKGKISYSDLRQIIFNYFEENQGLKLRSTSIDYLRNKLTGANDPQSFFLVKGEFGDASFDITREDIQTIVKSFFASKNYELSNLEYGYDVEFSYKQNSSINRENEEKVILDLTYDGSMRYEDLRQIIFDHYKETKGIELNSISIGYLQDNLTGANTQQPFFIRKDLYGETRFNIPKEQIQEIFKSYLAKKNYELEELSFDDRVEFKYKQVKKQEQKVTLESDNIVREEMILDSEEDDTNKLLNQLEEPKKEAIAVKDEELEKTTREKRVFTVLQRERAMSDAQKKKNQSALMAGICILGAAVATYFNGQDVNQIIQHQLDSIYSWEALGQYIKDLGPLTTLLTAAAGTFITKYCKHSKKFKDAQHEFEDLNAAIEITNAEELGGIYYAKSR